jgi:hypothetical protein
MLAKVFAEKKARKVGTASSVCGGKRSVASQRRGRDQGTLTSALGVGPTCRERAREREVSGLAESTRG